ncbi:MAG: NAD(P)/FAD-dependent oxidoreductase [Lachnospiraceae bacterium]|nr:NAD(P)/FAD-dependent oxidoreductase [Lachnospiraceae bacterium]
MHDKYPALFSPIKIGNLIFKNRMISAPMSAHYITPEGNLTKDSIPAFEILAKGGVAAVSIGESLVHSKTGNNHGSVLRLDDAGSIPMLYELTDTIHRYGALASIELVHPGRRADPLFNADGKTYGPSGGFAHYGEGEHEVTELDEEMISQIVGAYGDAAQMAKMGGCDFVTVHAGHGWLLNQFLSPANNQRTDRFGGSLENRARISLMVADDIRKKCGKDFVIDYRVSGSDFMEGGTTLDDIIEFAKLLEDKIDMLHVSATSFHDRNASIRMFPSMFHPRGVNAYLAAGIKDNVSIPVVTVGGFNDPAHMNEIIASGKADVIAMARALIADPFLPEKALNNNEDDITYCTRCENCISVGFVPYVKYNVGVSHCSVNPWHGLQAQYLRQTAGNKNAKILIIGGGPAGMQAAIAAAQQGNRVILAEKSERLGGMLNIASLPEFKKDIARYVGVLTKRINSYPNIEVRLNTVITPEDVPEIKPDKVIVAIGATPIELKIPGIEDERVRYLTKMLERDIELKDNIVIVGAGQAGVEEAIALASSGKNVTLIEQADRIASDAVYIHYLALLGEIKKHENINIILSSKCIAIAPEGVIAENSQGKTTYPADNIIIAIGMRANAQEAQKYLGTAPSVSIIGDCKKSSQMAEAVLAGYFAGYNA